MAIVDDPLIHEQRNRVAKSEAVRRWAQVLIPIASAVELLYIAVSAELSAMLIGFSIAVLVPLVWWLSPNGTEPNSVQIFRAFTEWRAAAVGGGKTPTPVECDCSHR